MTRLVSGFFLVCCMFLASSFVFGVVDKEEASAICKPGQYSEVQVDGSFKCATSGLSGGGAAGNTVTINMYIKNFAASLAAISLGVAVVMIAYSAILYTTGGAETRLLQRAKMHLLAAGIGLFVSFMAFVLYTIVHKIMIG